MCMEDIRIARKSASTSYVVQVPAMTTMLLTPQNNKRIYLGIRSSSGLLFNVDIRPITNANQGIPFAATNNEREIYLQKQGQQTCMPWYVNNQDAALTLNVSVMEVTLDME